MQKNDVFSLQVLVGAALAVTITAWMGASRGHAAETSLNVHGIMNVVGHAEDELRFLNSFSAGDSDFDHLRGRLFVDGGTDRTRAFVQIVYSDMARSELRLHGAYLLHRIVESQEIYFEAGKVPLHAGEWSPRTYANKNPLLSTPLAYYWKSNLPSRQVPIDLDQLIAVRGEGQNGVEFRDPDGTLRGTRYPTLPMLYDNCWDYGAFVLGSGERHAFAFGATQGSPGAPVAGDDTNGRLTLQGKVGYEVVPGLRLHLSAARGAYLSKDVTPFLPAGKSANDYAQQLYVASVDWGFRHLAVQAEAFANRFETPLRQAGLGSRAFYVQAEYTFLPSWYGAVRYDTLRFEEVQTSGGRATWDDNVQRAEVGIGFHASRELLVKLVGQLTYTGPNWRERHFIPATEISFSF